jgi:hypothetical protein
MLTQARWPNGTANLFKPQMANGGLSVDLLKRELTINNPDLPPADWRGAVVWTNEWYIARTATVINSAKGQVIASLTDSLNWDRGFWYVITGALGALDEPGEWHYDATTQTLYLWSQDGLAPRNIEVKQRNLAFDLSGRSHIKLSRLRIEAATVRTDFQSSYLIFDGIDAKYLSHYITLPDMPVDAMQPGTDQNGLVGTHIHDSGLELRGRGHILRNSRLAWSAGNLLLVQGENITVEANELGYANYMGSYGAALQIAGNGHRIVRNTFLESGRSAINVDWKLTGFSFRDVEIAFNEIRRFGALSTDLGAIYVCCRIDMRGTRIHHNRIHQGYSFSPFWDVSGIYLDIGSYNSQIDHNVIYGFDYDDRARSLKIYNEGADQLERIFNNTLLHSNDFGGRIEARNNIFGKATSFSFIAASNNLAATTNSIFLDAAAGDFQLRTGSPAIDAGVTVNGVTGEFVGPAPDIGAFESGLQPWQAGKP